MTTRNEMINAVKETHHFLYRLLDPKTPRVPKHIRLEARRLLKHYPFDMYVDEAFKDNNKMHDNT